MTDATKTPEQLAAEAAEAAKQKAEQKAAEAAAKAKQKAEAKAAKEAEAAKAKADREAAAKAKKEAAEKAKADAKAAKQAAKQPEQNGVRRPGPDGKCGKAWALMDAMSAKAGAPVAIADLLVASKAAGLNDNMTRSNYAAWRKFNGVTGRVLSQADIAKAQAAAKAAEQAKAAAAAAKAA